VKFIVTGTGHNGTAWTAKAFTWMGFPCGHESVYWWDENLAGARWFGLRGESSLAAAGYWHEIPTCWPVLLVIRDPFKVLSSFQGEKFFFDECDCHEPGAHRFSPYGLFVERHLPSCMAPLDPLGRAINWIVGWNEFIESEADFRPLRMERIEDLTQDTELLMDVVEWTTGERVSFDLVQGVQGSISPEINAHKRADLTWDDIMANPLGPRLAEFSIRHGYEGPP